MANLEKNKTFETEDEMRYRKKTTSDKSKSFNKSKHKHSYSPCLFYNLFSHPVSGIKHKLYYNGAYCVECGKIENLTTITDEEDIEKALKSKLSKCQIDSVLQKYIAVSKEISNE